MLRTAQVSFTLAATHDEAIAMRAKREGDPTSWRFLEFMRGISNLCAPEEAVELLLSLATAGFEYFVGGAGVGVECLELFARKVMRPVVDALLSSAT